MVRGKSGRWLGGLGAVVLVGGFVLASLGGGVTSAQAHDRNHKNPLKQILATLDEILAKLDQGGGGSGGATGNYTMRWEAHHPSVSRFTTVFTGAVMDKNTGLVWDHSPMVAPTGPTSWPGAVERCLNRAVGGTRGWRLPSVAELASVIDPSVPAPYVPGTVFTGLEAANYWSATPGVEGSSNAYVVSLQDGLVGTSSKSSSNNVWCVRGAM
ncbi:MAG: DUF1566 domain-containing protein [Nitrospira sp. CG24E]|nr:MAG: DUF1566 domain-containing protein [Nitrospira sp. CG24E]